MSLVKQTPDNKQRIDHGKVLKLHLRGLTEPEIGKIVGCCKQRVNQILRPYKGMIQPPDVIQAYEQNKASIFSSAEMQFLTASLDRLKTNKDALPARIMGFGTIFDKNRLVRGESTQNVSVHTAIEQIQSDITSLRAKRDAILEKLSK